MKKILVALSICLGISSFSVYATDIAQSPVESLGTVKPNIILGYDDSGSMALQELPEVESPLFTIQTRRSNYYNSLYYNPNVTYIPWIRSVATLATPEVRFANAAFVAPAFTNTGSANNVGSSLVTGKIYIATYDCNNFSTTFDFDTNLVFTSKTTCQNKNNARTRYTMTTNYLVRTGQSWQEVVKTSDALYFNLVSSTACTVDGVNCFTAPQCISTSTCAITPTGAKLQRVVIPFDDLVGQQNYANWKAYASERKYLVSYAMSGVLPNLKGLSVGFDPMNATSTVNNNVRAFDATIPSKTYTTAAYARTGKMYNLDVPSDVNTLLDLIYNTETGSATPTHSLMVRIGDTLKNASLPLSLLNDDGSNTTGRNGIVQFACQKNAAFILTDGYANGTKPAKIAYTKTTWLAPAPYSITYDQTLADFAGAFYTNNLRPDLAIGKVSKDTFTTNGNADLNSDLHMNTYALTLGIDGKQFTPKADPFANPPVWFNAATTNNDINQIDDLWHATINGRGKMFTAANTDNLIAEIQSAFTDILLRAGSQSAIAVANVNLTTLNNSAYIASFNASGWFGDVFKYNVNLDTGNVNTTMPLWSARERLAAQNWTTRKLLTKNNEVFGSVRKPAVPTGSRVGVTQDNMLNFLKGDRTNEGTLFRTRKHILGDAVNAEPVIFDNVVYQGTNDGFMHAFDVTTGNELWAYAPDKNLNKLGLLSKIIYNHQYYVDGTPTVGDYTISGVNKKILIGGLGAGDFGYYSIDITDRLNPKPLLEFPYTSEQIKNGGTTSIARPRFIATRDSNYPYVAILPSGYNNGVDTGGDGKGHVWVIDVKTGAVIKELVTSDGSALDPIGLSTFTAYVEDSISNNVVDYLYGGDEKGNIWKIDTRNNVSSWAITKFAALGKPITTKPEITKSSCGNPILLVGTGRLLGVADLTNTSIQSFYAIQDFRLTSAPAITPTRLSKLNVSGSTATNRVVSLPSTVGCLKWCSKDVSGAYNNYGWYFDFPEGGERAIGNPTIGLGNVAFTTNVISANSCSSSSYSWFLALNTDNTTSCATPTQVGANMGKYLGGVTGSRPVLVSLPNGHIKMVTHLGNGEVLTVDTGAFSLIKSAVRSWSPLNRPLR